MRAYVACRWPASAGVLKASQGIAARRAAIERAGFDVCLLRDGLELRANAGARQHFKKHPATTALVVPVLYEALRVAALLGAQQPPGQGGA
jgi:hypothetical protein